MYRLLATLLLILALPAWAGVTQVACDTNSKTLASQNTGRKLLIVYNEDTKNVRVKLGSAASTSSYTVLIVPGGYWELPPMANGGYYIGIVTGIWEAACTANALVTEY